MLNRRALLQYLGLASAAAALPLVPTPAVAAPIADALLAERMFGDSIVLAPLARVFMSDGEDVVMPALAYVNPRTNRAEISFYITRTGNVERVDFHCKYGRLCSFIPGNFPVVAGCVARTELSIG